MPGKHNREGRRSQAKEIACTKGWAALGEAYLVKENEVRFV